MTPQLSYVYNELQQLLLQTASDLAAIGVVDQTTRKISWYAVCGSISTRTSRIRQQLGAGLTGEVLRTGRQLQIQAAMHPSLLLGESIMLTEKLVQAAAWPLSLHGSRYNAILLIGKRIEESYSALQLEAGNAVANHLMQHCNEYCC